MRPNRRHFFITFFTACCGFISAQVPTKAEQESPKSVRVASYNVEFSANASAEQIGEMLKPYKLDVVGFNEAPAGDWGTRVGKILGMNYCYRGEISSANHKDKYKIILSRTPFLETKEIKIQGSGWQPASAVRAVCHINGIRFAFYSLHICGSNDKNGQAFHLADNVLPQERESRVVVVGDFNNLIPDVPMQHLKETGMIPTWEGLAMDLTGKFTWNAKDTSQREGVIDHILYNKSAGGIVTSGGIIELEKPLSDHKPVWAEIKFP